jgi:NTE family protein
MTSNQDGVPSDPVAIVLAGAGARGAYEAAFIATLLPYLGCRPKIFVGTSAGAINAALLASVAHLCPEDARDEIISRWQTIHRSTVLGPIVPSIVTAGLRYIKALLLGGTPPNGILDTRPLLESLGKKELIDWKQIQNNLQRGDAAVLAVVATESGSGRSKVFYDTSSIGGPIETDEDQAIDYVRTTLTPAHVKASAAIPVVFPPVQLEAGSRKSYFIDGGVRLNAPLKPALQFGASGVVVISTDPRRFGTSAAVDGVEPPSIFDQALQIMRGTFADRMIEDIRLLLAKNETVPRMKGETRDAGTGAGDPRYLPLIFGGPHDEVRVGNAADRAIQQVLRGPWRLFKNPDLTITNWLVSVSPSSAADLLSYILFEPEFIDEAIRAGIKDAESLHSDYPDPQSLWESLRAKESRKRLLRIAA